MISSISANCAVKKLIYLSYCEYVSVFVGDFKSKEQHRRSFGILYPDESYRGAQLFKH